MHEYPISNENNKKKLYIFKGRNASLPRDKKVSTYMADLSVRKLLLLARNRKHLSDLKQTISHHSPLFSNCFSEPHNHQVAFG